MHGGIFHFSLLTIILFFQYSPSESLRFPNLRTEPPCCTPQEECQPVTACPQALPRIRRGWGNPKICGWAGSEKPMVCCKKPSTTTETPITPRLKTVSHLSPKGCGNREPILPKGILGSVIHSAPVPEILEGGIEPRAESFSGEGPLMMDEGVVAGSQFAIGGVTATKKWPWMVAIFYGTSKKQLCGGTLIDDRHIITAAHCFVGKSLNPENYRVQVGGLNLREGGIDFDIEELLLHEDYRSRYYYNDIAIMRLPFALAPDFTPACLPGEDMVKEGDNVTVLGWGDLSFGGPSSVELQEVNGLPVVNLARCNAQFQKVGGSPFPRGITDTFICAGLEEGGKDACQGDSGGPLLHEHSKELWTLVGVVSFGYKCGEPEFSGVYTKVSSYIPWIERYIRSQNEVRGENSARIESVEEKEQNFDYVDGIPVWNSPPFEKVVFPS